MKTPAQIRAKIAEYDREIATTKDPEHKAHLETVCGYWKSALHYSTVGIEQARQTRRASFFLSSPKGFRSFSA